MNTAVAPPAVRHFLSESDLVTDPALLSLRVVAVRDIAIDIRLFEFHAADGTALPPAAPGAHIRLHLPNGIVRSYSLCNTPDEPGYRIAVKREAASRGASSWLHQQLRAGDLLSCAPPANAFSLHDSPHAPALLAAGIGITPLYAMAASLAASGRALHLHYFARSLGHAAFAAELDAFDTRHGMHLHLGLDTPASAAAIEAALHALPRITPLYLCGPHPFIEAVRTTALKLGWQPDDIHFELFGAPPTSIAPAPAKLTGFELVLQRSGRSCTVVPGQSIVEAAATLGVRIGTSCGEGFCGSCETAVLEGLPEHRDSVLSERERATGKTILPCVSRCAGARLVLDL